MRKTITKQCMELAEELGLQPITILRHCEMVLKNNKSIKALNIRDLYHKLQEIKGEQQ